MRGEAGSPNCDWRSVDKNRWSSNPNSCPKRGRTGVILLIKSERHQFISSHLVKSFSSAMCRSHWNSDLRSKSLPQTRPNDEHIMLLLASKHGNCRAEVDSKTTTCIQGVSLNNFMRDLIRKSPCFDVVIVDDNAKKSLGTPLKQEGRASPEPSLVSEEQRCSRRLFCRWDSGDSGPLSPSLCLPARSEELSNSHPCGSLPAAHNSGPELGTFLHGPMPPTRNESFADSGARFEHRRVPPLR
jgi:hypothetical protein